MKKIIIILCLAVIAFTAGAQPGYRHGPYPGNSRGYGHSHRGYHDSSLYGGIKFGITASHIADGSSELNASGIKSGITTGLAGGFLISPFAAFESGLYYVEKGGNGRQGGNKVTYNLNYLEIPLLLKINIFSGNRAVVQPYAGAYLGLGVGGQIKDYGTRISSSSFYDADFRRGDSGLAFGCGVTWSFLHANIGYEYGLTDISDSGFGDRHNRALTLTVGFAF
ncbi:MAG: PorT family protein [Bacteroidales bacterium]|nr:PorT family protein [Bacteroidales bacterium]